MGADVCVLLCAPAARVFFFFSRACVCVASVGFSFYLSLSHSVFLSLACCCFGLLLFSRVSVYDILMFIKGKCF